MPENTNRCSDSQLQLMPPIKVVLLMRCATSLCKWQQATMFWHSPSIQLSDAIRFAQCAPAGALLPPSSITLADTYSL